MKKLFISILFVSLSFVVFAQQRLSYVYKNYQEIDMKSLHYGFTLGLNYMDYNIAMKSKEGLLSEVVSPQPGFNVGIIGEYRLNDLFALRFTPGVIFGGRFIQYMNSGFKDVEASSSSVIFETPVLIKFFGKRYGNARGYLVAGGNARYDMNSESNFDPKNGIFTKNIPWDCTFEFGVGFDWYMQFFKLSTELRLSLGLMDVINRDITNAEKIRYASYNIEDYTNNTDRMTSKVVSLLFHFE